MKHNPGILFLLIFAALLGCRKSYTPAAIKSSESFMVVEGVINTGADTTMITLSRTVNISATSTVNPVTGATVSVESSQGATYPLSEIAPGSYVAAGLNLEVTGQYHLRIKTTEGKEYTSDFEGVKITPPIDSIGFTPKSTGLQIYVNTHDVNNNTHYYRWQYKETWRFHSDYYSQWKSDGTKIVPRPGDQDIYFCFANAASSSIVLGSSAKLVKDEIYQSPVTLIPSTSEKIELKYSILLSQYALTTDAYNFWVNLKKNTEQLGSIFDAQPSNINGNIHNVNDAAEVVIGYISVSTVQSKRIFITREQLPQSWETKYPYTCSLDSEYYINPRSGLDDVKGILINLTPTSYIPVSAFYLKGAVSPSGFMAAGGLCVDCTLRGSKTQPPFWQ